MTYTVGDDATITYPVTDTATPPGNLTFTPVVLATQWLGGTQELLGAWQGSPGASRDLTVPLHTLTAGLWTLHLVITGGPDRKLGTVVMVGAGDAPTEPGEPGGGVSIDHGAVGATLAITQAGSHEGDLTVNAAITVSTTGDVSLRLHGTGQTVTVAGETFTIDGTAVILVVTWPRGQDAYLIGEGTGGGEEPAPDTTPPTAVSGLTATGGSGTLSASWSAATDAESTVHYRYRYYLTSAGNSGVAWINTDSTSFPAATVAAGAYTVQVYAYSTGGASATASATATVTAPAGWNALIVDAFTATDGTVIGGRAPTTAPAGVAWTTTDVMHIMGNKMTQAPSAYNPNSTLNIPSGSRLGVGIATDYALATQTDTSIPIFSLGLNGGSVLVAVRLEKVGSTLSMTATNGGGHGPIALTGTTTGLPTTGRIGMRMIGSALSITLDGAEIAIGTAFSTTADSTSAYIGIDFGKNSQWDNFTIEEYTS